MCRVNIPEAGTVEAMDKRLQIITELYMRQGRLLAAIEEKTLSGSHQSPEFNRGYYYAMDSIREMIGRGNA